MSPRQRVLVEHDGQWYAGTLRSSVTVPDGTRTHLVTWRVPGEELRIDRVPCHRVRNG